MTLEQILKKHEINNMALLTDLKDAIDGFIPKDRFDEINTKYKAIKAELAGKEAELDSEKNSNKDIANWKEEKAKFEELLKSAQAKSVEHEKYVTEIYTKQWETAKAKLDALPEEKKKIVLGNFISAKDDKTALTLDELQKNVGKYTEYEAIGLFGDGKPAPEFSGKAPNGSLPGSNQNNGKISFENAYSAINAELVKSMN